MMQMPISSRTVFLDLNGVRASRGISADKVTSLVDSGELLWVFNFARRQGSPHPRRLRFWAPEIVEPGTIAKLNLDTVIEKILPASRDSFNSSELCQWFLLSRPQIKIIGRQLGGIVKNRLLRVRRERLVDYLRQRWIGGQNS